MGKSTGLLTTAPTLGMVQLLDRPTLVCEHRFEVLDRTSGSSDGEHLLVCVHWPLGFPLS